MEPEEAGVGSGGVLGCNVWHLSSVYTNGYIIVRLGKF